MLKTKQPLVSIVIPAYNGLPYLEEAIQSVLSQTYPNIELIVLNDGSKDETAEFLNKYQGRFYFETHANMGQAATLNKGWQISRGEILGYLSADDVLAPEAVEASVQEFLKNKDIVLTYPDYSIIDPQSRHLRNVPAPDYDYYKMIINVTCQVGVGSFFLQSAFNKIGGWDKNYRFVPDFEYQIRLAALGQFQRIKKILGSYRTHPGSASVSSVDFQRAEEIKIVMESLLNNTQDPVLKKHQNSILSRATLISGRTHWRSGRYKTAYSYFFQSVRLSPKSLINPTTYRIIFNALFNRSIHKLMSLFRKKIC